MTTRFSSERMVLLVSRYPPESHGPAWERIKHMALACGKVFGKTAVLTFQGKENRVNSSVGSKAFLYEIGSVMESPYPINAYFDPIKFVLLTAHGLLLSLRSKPLFVLVSMPPSEVGISAWIVAKLLHVDLVVDLRDDWESAMEQKLSSYIPRALLKVMFWVARKVYSSARVLLVATQTIGESVEKRGVKTSIMTAPNGADTSLFVPQCEDARKRLRVRYALPQNKIIVLYCGSGINPYYRLDRILKAVSFLPNDVKERVLLVFYLYNGVEQVKRTKEMLHIPDGLVEVREPVSRSVLAEIMAACDVGLVPFDNSPYLLCARSAKLYEYLSAGLYVIASGPENGELDMLFASNPTLGRFNLPYQKDFSEAFRRVVENEGPVSDENNRFLRHEFIQENHERMAIMIKAMARVRYLLSLDS